MILELLPPTNFFSLLDFLLESVACQLLLPPIVLLHFSHERTTQREIQAPKVFHVCRTFAPKRSRRRAQL